MREYVEKLSCRWCVGGRAVGGDRPSTPPPTGPPPPWTKEEAEEGIEPDDEDDDVTGVKAPSLLANGDAIFCGVVMIPCAAILIDADDIGDLRARSCSS